MVKYRLERKLTFEEMCKIVLKFKKDGLTVYDYALIENEFYVWMTNSCEDVSVTIDKCDITFDDYTAREALEEYEMIVNIMKEEN